MNLFSVVWVCSWCFGGTLFVILSIHLRHKAKALITKCTCNCKGILSEICSELREYSDEDNHNRKKMFYFPVYEFEVNEKKYKTRNTIGNSTPEKFKIGEIVEIRYNPENPNECYKEGDVFSKAWLVFFIVGILCIVEGVSFLLIQVII